MAINTALVDPFGRSLQYLRLSLTEACNMSCTYCLPDGFPEWYRHKARLGLAEIKTILEGFRLRGFRKIRFTGGEPTVHPHCLDAVKLAKELGYESICLTTNGLLIKDLTAWRDAGLTQINVSMDSLDPSTFEKMTKSPHLELVLQLINDAVRLGLKTKVNTVLMRSVNGSEISKLIDWALERKLTLRFIELMPTGLNSSFDQTERVLGKEIEPLLRDRGLTPGGSIEQLALKGPESTWSSANFVGQIGFINPLSCNFCADCNRLRVTSRGQLKLCLFGEQNYDLDLATPTGLAAQLSQLIGKKPEKHHLENREYGNVSTFRTIGG